MSLDLFLECIELWSVLVCGRPPNPPCSWLRIHVASQFKASNFRVLLDLEAPSVPELGGRSRTFSAMRRSWSGWMSRG